MAEIVRAADGASEDILYQQRAKIIANWVCQACIDQIIKLCQRAQEIYVTIPPPELTKAHYALDKAALKLYESPSGTFEPK